MLLFLKSKRKAVNLLKKSKFEVQFNFCQLLTEENMHAAYW